MELLAIWQRGFNQVCFALSEMGVEGAGGGLIGELGVLGCGVVMMEQVPRNSRCDGGERGPVADDEGGGGCAAKGARGGGSAHGSGGTGEW
jgi:hypothetical protein